MFNRFLESREMRVRVARIEDPEETPVPAAEPEPQLDLEKIADLTKEILKYGAIAAGCLFAAVTIVHTVSEVIINKSKNEDND